MATAKKDRKEKNPAKEETVRVCITPLRKASTVIEIVGEAPYVQCKMSQKYIDDIKFSQMQGDTAKKKKREPKDFKAAYEGAKHFSTEGWIGIPAAAFRNAMIDVCRVANFVMTKAKMSIEVTPDGFEDDGTPLVRIVGKPKYAEHVVRIKNTVDIRARPMWVKWSAKVLVTWDRDQFTLEDIYNLMHRAGQQVGIGEGRMFSKDSNGMGWGKFGIANELTEEAA